MLEILHSSGVNHRFHVNHAAVDGKPTSDGGLKLKIGVRLVKDQISNMSRVTVPPAQTPAVEALFAHLKERRSQP